MPLLPAPHRVIEHVVGNRQPAEVSVFTDLIRLCVGWQLDNVETPHGRGSSRILRDFRLDLGRQDLRACADNNADWLGILGTVARVAGHVDQVRAERVVQDRRSAIVARIGVGFCNAKLPVLIYLRHRTVVVVSRSNGRIDFSGRVGIRNVNCANRRQIAHEGQVVAIGRQIERQF